MAKINDVSPQSKQHSLIQLQSQPQPQHRWPRTPPPLQQQAHHPSSKPPRMLRRPSAAPPPPLPHMPLARGVRECRHLLLATPTHLLCPTTSAALKCPCSSQCTTYCRCQCRRFISRLPSMTHSQRTHGSPTTHASPALSAACPRRRTARCCTCCATCSSSAPNAGSRARPSFIKS